MIIKSNPIRTASGADRIHNYCTANTKNERIEILDGDYQDVADCVADAHAWGRKNSLLHMQISSREPLTDRQFMDMRDRIAQEFHLSKSDIVCSAIHEFKRKNDPDADSRHMHLLILTPVCQNP